MLEACFQLLGAAEQEPIRGTFESFDCFIELPHLCEVTPLQCSQPCKARLSRKRQVEFSQTFFSFLRITWFFATIWIGEKEQEVRCFI